MKCLKSVIKQASVLSASWAWEGAAVRRTYIEVPSHWPSWITCVDGTV